jgi:hypothetical protein
VPRRQSGEANALWRAYTVGAGIVNGGEHLYGEVMLHVSPLEDVPRALAPYAAARLSQVVPLTRQAVSDTPTFGVAFGVKIGDAAFAFVPEVGLLYDKSALGLTSKRLLFVPSLSIIRRPR